MNAAPSILSTSGLKRSVTEAIERSSPCTVFTVMPSTARNVDSVWIGGGNALVNLPLVYRKLVLAKQPHLLNRDEPVTVLGPQFDETIGYHVDDRAGRKRRLEAAAHAQVERQIESFQGHGSRTPRRGRDHADAADQHVDVMAGALISRRSRPGICHAAEPSEKRRDFGHSGRDHENPHDR